MYKFGVFFLVCAFILILGEAIVRFWGLAPTLFDYKIFEPMHFVDNPRVCYKMRPGGDCEGGRLNSEGFKDNEFLLEKGKDLFRIVMLGDSITKGTGIPLGLTFSDELERLLNSEHQDSGPKIRYEVMNFGVGGYNIVSEVEALKVYALRYRPDLVVLNYFYNDNEEHSFNYWFFLDKPDATAEEKNLIYNYYLSSNQFSLNRLLFRSHLYRFLWARVHGLLQPWREVRPAYGASYAQDIVLEKLQELQTLGQEHGFKVFVALHPVLDYDKAEPHQNYATTERSLRDLRIPYLNLRTSYQRASSDPRVFLQADGEDTIHPNVTGHNVVAHALYKALDADGLIVHGEASR